jgi:hypothetical protein
VDPVVIVDPVEPEPVFVGRPAVEQPEDLRGGIKVSYYKKDEGEEGWSKLPDFEGRTPFKTDVLNKIDNKAGSGFVLTSGLKDHVAAVFEGYIHVPENGDWTLGTNSDDGSKLWIGDELVVDNDGLHGDREKKGNIKMAEGLHPIRVEMFERGGGATIQVKGGYLDEEEGSQWSY